MQRELPHRGTRVANTDDQIEGIHTGGAWEEIHLMTAGRWDRKATLAFPATASRGCFAL